MFDRHGSGRNPGNMGPTDLEQIVDVVGQTGSVVVQLSTYSANNDNGQDRVRNVILSGLEGSGLEVAAVVRANGNMMSVVLARDVEEMEAVRSLPKRFEEWL